MDGIFGNLIVKRTVIYLSRENTAQRVFLYTANEEINDARHATILGCHDSDIMHCDVDSGAKLLLGDFYGYQIQARHYYRRGNARHI